MRKLRMAAGAAMLSSALLLGGLAGPAAAQSGTPAFDNTVPVTGTAKNGKRFTGTYTIRRFVAGDGEAVAVGVLKGRLKGRKVTRRGVRMPVTILQGAQTSQLPDPTEGACTILTLVLGPIDLNLLGLRVATNEIRLLVEAIPGAGNLLGNLLCAVTNLLNPQAQTPLQQLVGVLNALLALARANVPIAGGARAAAAAGA